MPLTAATASVQPAAASLLPFLRQLLFAVLTDNFAC